MSIKKISLFLIIFTSLTAIYSGDLSQAKSSFKTYMDAWFINAPNTDEWLLEVNNFRFGVKGLENGLKNLEENFKKSELTSEEKKTIKDKYVETYIDQLSILANAYEDLLNYPELDLLLQEFLRQAATQIWLENKMKKNPKSAEPTADEINKYYKENSDRLLRLGLSASQIKVYTEQELRQLKLQEWTYRQVQEFKNTTPVTINAKMQKKLGFK